MKNLRTLLIYMLTLLLSAVLILPAEAQEKAVQDALYIYRNDGGFNALFFDTIDRFEYSKIDTLGVEHDEYVVQEVYALDTLFRIPLSAIDSISFVTPENKVKSDVFQPDKSIVNYIVASDSAKWIRLALNTPEALIPQVGQKVLILDDCDLIPFGFGGMVSTVNRGADGITVIRDKIELTDLFDRLVVKAACGPSPDSTEVAAARRKAMGDSFQVGFGSMTPIDLPRLKQNCSFKKNMASQDLIEDILSVQGTPGSSLSLDLDQKITACAFLVIDAISGIRTDCFIKASFDGTIDFDASGKLTGHLDIPVMPAYANTSISEKFEAIEKGIGWLFGHTKGRFKAFLMPRFFVEGSGTLVFKTHGDVKFSAGARMNACSDYVTFIKTLGSEGMTLDGDISAEVEKADFTNDSGFGEFTLTIGGGGKIGIKLEFLDKTEFSFLEDTGLDYDPKVFFEATTNFDSGFRWSIDNPVFPKDVPDQLFDTRDGKIYEKLDKDDNYHYVCLLGVGTSGKIGLFDWNPDPKEFTYFPFNSRIIPKLSSFSVDWGRDKIADVTGVNAINIRAEGACAFKTPIGFAIFDEKGEKYELDWWAEMPYYSRKDDVYMRIKTDLNSPQFLYPAKDTVKVYYVYPQINYFGKPILVNQKEKIELNPAFLKAEKDTIFISTEKGKFVLNYESNIPLIYLRFDETIVQIDGGNCYDGPDGRRFAFYNSKLPDGKSKLVSKIILIGQRDDKVLASDTVVIVQELSPIKKIYFKTFNKVHSEIVKYNNDEPNNFWNWLLMDAEAESHEMDLLVTKDNFTINSSTVGNTLHVDCVGSAQGFGMTQKANLSFDVVNYNATEPNKAMVTNVKFSNDVTISADGQTGSMDMAVDVDNIPVWNLSPLYIAAAGTVANGVKFSNFYDVISLPDGKATGYYVNDIGNNALLRISFEGNDDDDWSDVIDNEEDEWGDDDDGGDDWGNWSRNMVKKVKRLKGSNVLERRVLEQLRKAGKQNK